MKEKHLNEEEISLFLENDIDEKRANEIKEHLKYCEECKAKMLEIKKVEEILSEPPLLEPPPSLLNTIMEKVARKRIKLEELFISIFIGFLGLFATLFYLIYTKGTNFVINMLIKKINITFFIKNGISNFGELLSVMKKLFYIILKLPTKNITPNLLYLRIAEIIILTIVLIGISLWKKDVVLKKRKR